MAEPPDGIYFQSGWGNIDGGAPDSNYGGISPIVGGTP